MASTSSKLASRYVYAVVRDCDTRAIEELQLHGLHEAEIEIDVIAGLAVVNSQIEEGILRPQRKLLAAHQRVVSEIAKRWDMLPVSFGLIANGISDLEAIVETHAGELSEALDRVSGKVEMNVVLQWTADEVFQYLVDKHPELQSARDMIASGKASRDEMIEIGRQVESVLKTSRQQHLQTLLDGLSGVCSQIDTQDPKQEKEIVRLNCLVDRQGEPAFVAALEAIASGYNEEFAFSYNGPWPPYSFVNLKLTAE